MLAVKRCHWRQSSCDRAKQIRPINQKKVSSNLAMKSCHRICAERFALVNAAFRLCSSRSVWSRMVPQDQLHFCLCLVALHLGIKVVFVCLLLLFLHILLLWMKEAFPCLRSQNHFSALPLCKSTSWCSVDSSSDGSLWSVGSLMWSTYNWLSPSHRPQWMELSVHMKAFVFKNCLTFYQKLLCQWQSV